jgi:hypothetical protein
VPLTLGRELASSCEKESHEINIVFLPKNTGAGTKGKFLNEGSTFIYVSVRQTSNFKKLRNYWHLTPSNLGGKY